VLNSVKVYAGSAGNRTIALQNSSGGTLQSATVNISAGVSRVALNFNVPVGTNMRLAITSASPNLYRNSGGITFPYTLAGKISITGTNAASTRYYFFYDWEIDHTSCTSPQVPVTATIIQPAIPSFTHSEVNLTSYFTNTSTNATSYLWKFGDGATSTQTNPSHTYAAEGDYDVVLIAYNSCGSDSVITTINASTVGGIQNATEAGRISIYPIPSKGIVFLGYQTSTSQNCNIEVINMVGDVVLRDKVRFIPGENSTAIDLNSLQTGIYFMKLIMDNSSVIRKIIIE
jgi:PKD repeat protein